MTYYISYFYAQKECSFGFGYVVSEVDKELSLSQLNDIMRSRFNPEYMASEPIAISWQPIEVE